MSRGQLDSLERQMVEIGENSIRPPLPLFITRRELHPGKAFLVVEVPRGRTLHESPGGAFRRTGSSKRRMGSDERLRLAQRRAKARFAWFDRQPVPSTGFRTLEEELWRPLIGDEGATNPEDALRQLNLVTEDEAGASRASVAGVLLCAEKPHTWLTQARIVATCYEGGDRASRQLDAFEITGPLPCQISDGMHFVRRNVRMDPPQYSLRAVFEAVVNAVAHRDYSIKERRIRLSMFRDRLELSSPGEMPERPATRNETLTSILRRTAVGSVHGAGEAFLHGRQRRRHSHHPAGDRRSLRPGGAVSPRGRQGTASDAARLDMTAPLHYRPGAFPPDDRIDWGRLVPLLGPTAAAIGRYDGFLSACPNPEVLREAVAESEIHRFGTWYKCLWKATRTKIRNAGVPTRRPIHLDRPNGSQRVRLGTGWMTAATQARPRAFEEVERLPRCPDVVHAARKRGVREVVHFTTISGLIGILAKGAVLSRARLEGDKYLEYVCRPNAPVRKDEAWLDYVSLSVSRINDWMFEHSERWQVKNDNPWVVLAFDPALLGDPGVVFATTNNIYPACRRAEGLVGFEGLFAESVAGRYGKLHDREEKPRSWPTDRQAEVLYPGQVSCRYLLRVDVQREETLDVVAGLEGTLRVSVPVRHTPAVFQ